jgi:cell wall-associated NlpC family hydrolase
LQVAVLGGVRRVATWIAVLAALSPALAFLPSAGASAATDHAAAAPFTSDFWLATPSGTMLSFGVPSYGSAPGPLNQPIVTTAPTGDRRGYWMVASDGGVFSFGDAHFFGSTGSLRLNRPIVGMAPTADQRGYWLVASDGGIFSFGDATFYGSTGSLVLNRPIVGMASTPDQRGYWLVASDGGVFSFGDATFYGSTGSLVLDQPVASMTPTPDGHGYWLVASDGGIFAFGDATFHGSAAGTTGEPVERIVRTASGAGYWIVEQNGTELPYGNAIGATPPVLALELQPITPGDRAVLFASEQLGKPYIWGGNGPVGYDCSGLALASWRQGAGITFARVADDQYHTAGAPVAMNDLQAGDLVFWGTDLADWTSVYHTALYVGGNRIVEATGNQVQLNLLDQWGTDNLMPNGRRP